MSALTTAEIIANLEQQAVDLFKSHVESDGEVHNAEAITDISCLREAVKMIKALNKKKSRGAA